MLRFVVPGVPVRDIGCKGRGAARRHAAARAAPRPHRRQVAGRIPGRRAAPSGAHGRAAALAGAARHAARAEARMAKILDVRGRRVWDSRGRPTVEAEVVVGRGTTPLAVGRAIAPSGASTGSGEAKALDAETAVRNINGRIRDALKACSASEQQALDERLIELDGTPDRHRLGANAMVAVSLACAQADAAARKVPLWKKLADERRELPDGASRGAPNVSLPVPQIQIFGGGAHAHGSVDLQDYMIICIGAGSFAEALEWTARVYAAAGARLA